jgi:hypothetical protein
MNRTRTLFALLAACAIALAGCAAKETKWSGEAASLVVYARAIPLYPGAKAVDAMGSDSYGDEPDSHTEGMTVMFEVEGYDKAKVLAWYEERLPGAQRQVLDTGSVELVVPAPNGEPGEEIGVWIDDDGFRVFENTKAGKHKDS